VGDRDHSIVLIGPTHLPQIDDKAHRLEVDGVPHIAIFKLTSETGTQVVRVVQLFETDREGDDLRAAPGDATLLHQVASALSEYWRTA